MPIRMIKESIWDSPSINQLSIEAERFFYRLLPLPDDSGCFQATAIVVKGRCFPLQSDCISTAKILQWYCEMEKAGILKFWNEGERLYGFFVNWDKHQRIRSKHHRKTPPPPTNDSGWCQLSSSVADCGYNPNPNPNPNPKKKNTAKSCDEGTAGDEFAVFLTKKKRKLTGVQLERFEVFWNVFDYKRGKAEAADSWYDLSDKTEETFQDILKGAEREAKVRPDILQQGKTPKMAQGWLSARRWEDEELPLKTADTMENWTYG